MHYTYRNVDDAFHGLVEGIVSGKIHTVKRNSRNGPVLRIPGPVIITYTHPRERVLYNRVRDCNPFFHVFESLWMLAGRNDVASLDYYNSNMKNYSDNGETFHGAYGYRWRKWMGFDQLDAIINTLFHNKTDRRSVLQMWDSNALNDETTDSKAKSDAYMAVHNGKDVPCNLMAVFEVEKLKGTEALNMTVFNRSNDLVWGMLGANAVHFSFLQEYMARCIGVDVGRYHQVTNNLHAYADKWLGEEYLKDDTTAPDLSASVHTNLVVDKTRFDEECGRFVDNQETFCTEPFLLTVAQPMMTAFRHHKERDYNRALEAVEQVQAPDWKLVCKNWLIKRRDNWQRNKNDKVRLL